MDNTRHNGSGASGPTRATVAWVCMFHRFSTWWRALSVVLLGLATLERHGALRLGRWASRLGAISYPLYILHTSMMLIFDECCHGWLKLGTAGLYALFLGGLAGIYLVAMLAAFGIDQPLQHWLRGVKISGAFLKKSAQKTSATLGQGR
ncbi:MAG: hypothetical protein B7Z81_01760 [Acidocella sp. 20-61-6]|nr:MAG: hypothetical protein B7Z81_01760 [Acidocella sp. 20-61-6]